MSRVAEEQAAFSPLAARPYRSLVLTPPAPPPPPPARTPRVPVERRPLTSYAHGLTEVG